MCNDSVRGPIYDIWRVRDDGRQNSNRSILGVCITDMVDCLWRWVIIEQDPAATIHLQIKKPRCNDAVDLNHPCITGHSAARDQMRTIIHDMDSM
jgi:hypothetical protein